MPPLFNWDVVDFSNPESRRQLVGALNHVMRAPDENLELRAAFQHLATTGDFPTSILPLIEKYRLETPFDTGWEQIFDVRDFRASKRNGFEILDVENGLAFNEVPTGADAILYKMAGEKVTVNFVMYGGGLSWSRTLIDDEEYWTLEDNAIAFRNKAGAQKAQAHYDLIDAIAATQNLAWQAPVPANLANTDPNYVAIRDIETINTACVNIIVALAGKGMGVTANTQFVLLAPIQLRTRIVRALGLLNQSLSGSQKGVLYNVTPVWTTMLASTTEYYVCAPKIKCKSGRRMDLTVFERFDEMSYSDVAVGWMRYGGAIGDVEQFERCSTS